MARKDRDRVTEVVTMHYMDNDTRRQLVREHTQGLADEMRRARVPTPPEPDGAPSSSRLAIVLAQRLRRGTDGRAPAYDS